MDISRALLHPYVLSTKSCVTVKLPQMVYGIWCDLLPNPLMTSREILYWVAICALVVTQFLYRNFSSEFSRIIDPGALFLLLVAISRPIIDHQGIF